jgi:hypothetical protein
MASEDGEPRSGSQIGSRLSVILQEFQKRQVADTTPQPKQRPKKRSITREVVVAVMGVTGAGKSSFIRKVTGNDEVRVGEGLQSGEAPSELYRLRQI